MSDIRQIAGVALLDTAPMQQAPELTREGYLRVTIQATRAGIMPYTLSDGQVIKLLRPKAEVFKPESMATLKVRPCTRKHPAGLLTAQTARGAMVGSTGDMVSQNAEILSVDATIFDGPTISAMQAGKDEVSVGVHATINVQAGIDPEFGPFDGWVENIIYNHVAVALEQGEARGGPQMRALMDSKDFKPEKPEATVDKMKKIKLGDDEHEVTENLHDAIKAHIDGLNNQNKANHDKLAEQLGAVKHQHGELKDDMEALAEGDEGDEASDSKVKTPLGKKISAKFIAASAKVKAGKALMDSIDAAGLDKTKTVQEAVMLKVAAAASERARLVGVICAMDSKAAPADLFKKDDLELMKQAIVIKMPKATFDGMDSARIMGQFDMVSVGVKPDFGKTLGAQLLDARAGADPTKKAEPAKGWVKPALTSSKTVKA